MSGGGGGREGRRGGPEGRFGVTVGEGREWRDGRAKCSYREFMLDLRLIFIFSPGLFIYTFFCGSGSCAHSLEIQIYVDLRRNNDNGRSEVFVKLYSWVGGKGAEMSSVE